VIVEIILANQEAALRLIVSNDLLGWRAEVELFDERVYRNWKLVHSSLIMQHDADLTLYLMSFCTFLFYIVC
jgi:hypothetical protein